MIYIYIYVSQYINIYILPNRKEERNIDEKKTLEKSNKVL